MISLIKSKTMGSRTELYSGGARTYLQLNINLIIKLVEIQYEYNIIFIP